MKRVAEEMGYRPDPLVAAFQVRLRASRPVRYQATLGWIDDHREPDFWQKHREVVAARKRAETLGYALDIVRIEEVRLDDPADTARRFQRILQARGINGVILPRLDRAHLLGEEWAGFAVVSLGHNSELLAKARVRHKEDNPYHEVGTDSVFNMKLAIKSLRLRGYERIGLVVSEWHNALNDGVPHAFMLADNTYRRTAERVPPLMLPEPSDWSRSRVSFCSWFKKHRPAAILISNRQILGFCRELGLKVPADIALAHIEKDVEDEDLSGIDPRRDLQAGAAVDLLASMLVRNERETPPFQKQVLIRGVWREAGTA